MKLELSKDETTNVFSVYGSALKDAAEGRAQVQRLTEKLTEAETAKRSAIRAKEDSDYNLSSTKSDLEYQKGGYKNLQTQNNTLNESLRLVRVELDNAKKALANVQVSLPGPSIQDQNARDIKVLTPILDAIAHGNKIDAIRMVRELTQLGLKESKDMVEGTALKPPTKASSGCGG